MAQPAHKKNPPLVELGQKRVNHASVKYRLYGGNPGVGLLELLEIEGRGGSAKSGNNYQPLVSGLLSIAWEHGQSGTA